MAFVIVREGNGIVTVIGVNGMLAAIGEGNGMLAASHWGGNGMLAAIGRGMVC